MVDDVLSLATLKGGNPAVFLEAARLMNEHRASALDALHAAFCGHEDRLLRLRRTASVSEIRGNSCGSLLLSV
jgi:hypothetical protein